MSRRFQGIIGPKILAKSSFSGREAQTEAEKYELTLDKVKQICLNTTNKPIRESHKQKDIGKILRNWVTSDLVWYVDFEIYEPEDGVDYVDKIRSGVFNSLSLSHWRDKSQAIEVSICKVPVRDGSKILREVCDTPESCGSNGDLYKMHQDDIIISAAKDSESENVSEMSATGASSTATNKDKDEKSLNMDEDDELGAPPKGNPIAKELQKPKQPTKPLQQPQKPAEPVDDLSEGAIGLEPAPEPTPPVRGHQPSAGAGSKAPAHKPPVPPQRQPQRAPPPPPPPQPAASSMDDTDEGTAAAAAAAAAVPLPTAGAAAANGSNKPKEPTAAELAQAELKQDMAFVKRMLKDQRLSSDERDYFFDREKKNAERTQRLEMQLTQEKQRAEQAERNVQRLGKMAQSGKNTVVDGFTKAMKSQGADDKAIENIKQLLMGSLGDTLVEQGGDAIISACRRLAEDVEVDDEKDEALRRFQMLEHLHSGRSADTFEYSRPTDKLKTKPRETVKGRRTLTSSSGMQHPKDEKSPAKTPAAVAAVDEQEDRGDDDDEKVSAAREEKSADGGDGSGWSSSLYHDLPDPRLMKEIAAMRLDCAAPGGMKYTVPADATVHISQGQKRSHRDEPVGWRGEF